MQVPDKNHVIIETKDDYLGVYRAPVACIDADDVTIIHLCGLGNKYAHCPNGHDCFRKYGKFIFER